MVLSYVAHIKAWAVLGGNHRRRVSILLISSLLALTHTSLQNRSSIAGVYYSFKKYLVQYILHSFAVKCLES